MEEAVRSTRRLSDSVLHALAADALPPVTWASERRVCSEISNLAITYAQLGQLMRRHQQGVAPQAVETKWQLMRLVLDTEVYQVQRLPVPGLVGQWATWCPAFEDTASRASRPSKAPRQSAGPTAPSRRPARAGRE